MQINHQFYEGKLETNFLHSLLCIVLPQCGGMQKVQCMLSCSLYQKVKVLHFLNGDAPLPSPTPPNIRLTTTLSVSSRARWKTERQEACIPPGLKVFYRPSHTLFLFFSHHQPPTNNTRKGSALCLDGGMSVLSVLIRCLIQQRA